MRTVGKIIKKNGQKVYKRFGAATKQKIKLGTAAFADIVKSTSVTEEGSVPDAILVTQQQQLISELQGQVDSLNSAIENMKSNISSLSENVYTLSGTTRILPNSDLNNYFSIGNYYSISNSDSTTFLNSPSQRAFTLKVDYGNGTSYPRQTLIDFLGENCYARNYSTYSNQWTEWTKVY